MGLHQQRNRGKFAAGKCHDASMSGMLYVDALFFGQTQWENCAQTIELCPQIRMLLFNTPNIIMYLLHDAITLGCHTMKFLLGVGWGFYHWQADSSGQELAKSGEALPRCGKWHPMKQSSITFLKSLVPVAHDTADI